jgi:hypothetical protein
VPVTNQTLTNEYTGNGITTAYAFTFFIISESQLAVYLNGDLQNSGYTVSGAGNQNGGTVTFSSAPASSTIVRIIRDSDPVRETDYSEAGGLASATLDSDQDYQTQLIQEVHQYTLQEDRSTGEWNAEGKRIKDLGDPETGSDAVTAAYVDTLVTNIISGGAITLPRRFSFDADGIETTFSLPNINVTTPDAYLVSVDGVLQEPETDFEINVASKVIEFTEAPPDGSRITVRVFGYSLPVQDV